MSRSIPEEPKFDLACRGYINGKAARKILFELNEKDVKAEIILPSGTIEKSPAMLGTFLAGISYKPNVQAPEKRGEENWFWHSPKSEEIKQIYGFPNPEDIDVEKFTLRAQIKKRGYVAIIIEAMPEYTEAKQENQYAAERITIKAKLELPGEAINKEALAEAAVEIYEIQKICEQP